MKNCYFHYLEKLIEHFATAVSEVLSNPFVCPLPKIKLSLFLLFAGHRSAHIISKNNGIFTLIKIWN